MLITVCSKICLFLLPKGMFDGLKESHTFCNDIETVGEMSRIRIILATSQFVPSVLQRADGLQFSSDTETWGLLMDTYFQPEREIMLSEEAFVVVTDGNCFLFTFIVVVKWTIDSLSLSPHTSKLREMSGLVCTVCTVWMV